MKKLSSLLAVLLLAVMLLSTFTACGDAAKDPNTGASSGEASGNADGDGEKPAESDLKVGTYRITNVGTGKPITYNQDKGELTIGEEGQTAVGLNIVYVKGERKYVMEFFSKETKQHNDKNVTFDNYEINQRALTVSSLSKREVKVQQNKKSNIQQWTALKNDDGTYTFSPRANKKLALIMTDNGLTINESLGEDIAKWKVESISTNNDFYLEYVSEEGNVAVRLALDMLKKTPITGERVIEWANDIEKVLDAYEELTSFHAQDTVFIHAYNYQGVMAGVIGTDQVYVNCGPNEWFYSDMKKMAKRTTLGAHDINFMALHEIGHLFDYDRGWNFESEMTADLKAAYALYSIKDSVAAPSEFGEREYFDYKHIHEGYNKLGGGKMTDKYSIYRLAELMTNISYEIGWEPFKQTFAWFQTLTPNKYPEKGSEKFDTFLAKLSEYSGKDVESMISDAEKKICRTQFDS